MKKILILLLTLFCLAGSANAIECWCFSCFECTDDLTNPVCDLVKFSGDIVGDGFDSCIDRPLADNKVLDCRHWFIFANDQIGAEIEDLDNFTMRNCAITGAPIAIQSTECRNCTFEGSYISNNDQGLHVTKSPGGYYYDNEIRQSGDGLVIHQSPNNVIDSNYMYRNDIAMKIVESDNNVITNNRFRHVRGDAGSGVVMTQSSFNEFSNNRIYKTLNGMFLDHSTGNVFYENRFENNTNYGLRLNYVTLSTFDDNAFNRSNTGLIMQLSSKNNFTNNMIYNNYELGVNLSLVSKDNFFQYNNITLNGMTAYEGIGSKNNNWNGTLFGNYWDDVLLNPGYPFGYYMIYGPGNGIDYKPIWDGDGDGFWLWEDCDDQNENVNPGMNESCITFFDDNCDGTINEGCPTGSPVVMKGSPIMAKIPQNVVPAILEIG